MADERRRMLAVGQGIAFIGELAGKNTEKVTHRVQLANFTDQPAVLYSVILAWKIEGEDRRVDEHCFDEIQSGETLVIFDQARLTTLGLLYRDGHENVESHVGQVGLWLTLGAEVLTRHGRDLLTVQLQTPELETRPFAYVPSF